MDEAAYPEVDPGMNDASDKERVAAVFLQSADLDRSGVGFCRAHAPAHVRLAAALTEALLYAPDFHDPPSCLWDDVEYSPSSPLAKCCPSGEKATAVTKPR